MQKISSAVVWDSPVWAAENIVKGVVMGRREIFHPHHLVFPVVISNILFPGLLDGILLESMSRE